MRPSFMFFNTGYTSLTETRPLNGKVRDETPTTTLRCLAQEEPVHWRTIPNRYLVTNTYGKVTGCLGDVRRKVFVRKIIHYVSTNPLLWHITHISDIGRTEHQSSSLGEKVSDLLLNNFLFFTPRAGMCETEERHVRHPTFDNKLIRQSCITFRLSDIEKY